jgi:phosphatidylinositol alpha-1,6-mannosyltransferase
MKILIFSPDFLPNTGGIAVFVHNICIQLVRLGHEVDVLTTRKIADHSDKPYKVYQYEYDPGGRLSSMKAISAIFSLYLKRRYDLLFFGHFVSTHALGGVLLTKIFKVPYIMLCHGNDVLRYGVKTTVDRLIRKVVLRNANIVLANSNFTKSKLKNELNIGSEVLNPGVDIALFLADKDDRGLREKHQINKNATVLLSAGRLVNVKNYNNIIKAVKRVKEKTDDLMLFIAGEGPERENIIECAKSEGVYKNVVLIGNVEAKVLRDFYLMCNVFVLPSITGENDYEAFGMVFLEAGACGKPVVGSKTGGISDAVIDKETGLLVNDPSDVKEIADAILYLLNNKQIADEMGRKARERIVAHFDWTKVGEKLKNIIETASGQKCK